MNAAGAHAPRPRQVRLGDALVTVTDVFWAYWQLAAKRQDVFFRRAAGQAPPWTTDPVLSRHRFTNTYRASDRVTQYLLHNVIYDTEREATDTVLRVLVFKIFNRPDTWQHLTATVGEPTAATFDVDAYARALEVRHHAGDRIYNGAYVMAYPPLGHERKHRNHLALLDMMLKDGTLTALTTARSLEGLYHQLTAVPSFGRFLAYQFAIDLNYTPHFEFDEMEFVVAGPGAVRGVAKCFADTAGLSPEQIITRMAGSADRFLADTDPPWRDLFGRPPHLIDIQNVFCEVDKYARARYPEHSTSGPKRIKQRFRPDPAPLPLGYPPKWGLPLLATSPRQWQHATALGGEPGERDTPGGAAGAHAPNVAAREATALEGRQQEGVASRGAMDYYD